MIKMYIDDVRCPPDDDWILVRSSDEAVAWVTQNGMPDFISFDHDLGGEDTTMVFLKKIVELGLKPPNNYHVHSANPIGKQNIVSFVDSWKRVMPST